MIPAIILAAGAGQRMGGPKALLCLEGETLLSRMVRVAGSVGCQPMIAVIGDWDPGSVPPGAQLVRNPEAAEGMASSIRRGVAALPEGAEAVLILVVDQPKVDAALLGGLLQLAAATPDRPTACAYSGTIGIPAILPRRLCPDLLALQGDRGAKAILQREDSATLPFPGGEIDLDSPADLEQFRR